MSTLVWVIIVVATFVIAAVVGFALGNAYRKNIAEAKVGKAEDKAKDIIDDALKAAVALKIDILQRRGTYFLQLKRMLLRLRMILKKK